MSWEHRQSRFDAANAAASLADEVRMMMRGQYPDVGSSSQQDCADVSSSDVGSRISCAPTLLDIESSCRWSDVGSDISMCSITDSAPSGHVWNEQDLGQRDGATRAAEELASEMRKGLPLDAVTPMGSALALRVSCDSCEASLRRAKRSRCSDALVEEVKDSRRACTLSSSGDMMHELTLGGRQSRHPRRRWRASILVQADGLKNGSSRRRSGALSFTSACIGEPCGVSIMVEDVQASGDEDVHVPLLPLQLQHPRWRRSTFRQSMCRRLSSSEKLTAKSSRTGLRLKRLRRISERRLQQESAAVRDRDSSEAIHIHLPISDFESASPTVAPLKRLRRFSQRFLASIVGDAQLPGWSARLILCLGGGALTAKPLACASRHTAWSLLRDAMQLTAELRPTSQALSSALAWGDQEEMSFGSLKESATMLAVLTRLEISSCNAGSSLRHVAGKRRGDSHGASTRPRRRTRDRAVEILRHSEASLEQARVHRVGCLLKNLARRARSLSRRLPMPALRASTATGGQP